MRIDGGLISRKIFPYLSSAFASLIHIKVLE